MGVWARGACTAALRVWEGQGEAAGRSFAHPAAGGAPHRLRQSLSRLPTCTPDDTRLRQGGEQAAATSPPRMSSSSMALGLRKPWMLRPRFVQIWVARGSAWRRQEEERERAMRDGQGDAHAIVCAPRRSNCRTVCQLAGSDWPSGSPAPRPALSFAHRPACTATPLLELMQANPGSHGAACRAATAAPGAPIAARRRPHPRRCPLPAPQPPAPQPRQAALESWRCCSSNEVRGGGCSSCRLGARGWEPGVPTALLQPPLPASPPPLRPCSPHAVHQPPHNPRQRQPPPACSCSVGQPRWKRCAAGAAVCGNLCLAVGLAGTAAGSVQCDGMHIPIARPAVAQAWDRLADQVMRQLELRSPAARCDTSAASCLVGGARCLSVRMLRGRYLSGGVWRLCLILGQPICCPAHQPDSSPVQGPMDGGHCGCAGQRQEQHGQGGVRAAECAGRARCQRADGRLPLL